MKKKASKKKRKTLFNYTRYSSLAFQMMAIILLGVFGGMKLDQLTQWKIPVFTVILSVLSVSIAIYIAVKDLLK